MSLRDEIVARTQAARDSGHLASIPTAAVVFERHGARWVTRLAPQLAAKKQDATRPRRNPFLPYEPELFVADVSDTHVCLLNKFNVVEHHLVIVTRHFEHQRTLLTVADVDAAARVLTQLDGLLFYNAGEPAGSSQPHKHLQWVPSVDPRLDTPPVEQLLHALPYLHAHAAIELGLTDLHATYRALLTSLERDPRTAPAIEVERAEPPPDGAAGERQQFPHDLLLTRRRMLIVPRTRESHAGIQINSLGFAGAFLVTSQDQQRLVQSDPFEVLVQVGIRAKG
jgi:ATP adenylyltransferase